MVAPAEPVLFHAVCTPPRSLTPGAFRIFALLLGLLALATGGLFLALGAWPILPFLGLEVGFALGLVALHARGAARAAEIVMLTPDRLTVRRMDARGRREEVSVDAYWARIVLADRPGAAPVLRIESRGRTVEIGRDLVREEKAALRDALSEALARARDPRFDNPQLREG
jgi:uncharacterized membrane protein